MSSQIIKPTNAILIIAFSKQIYYTKKIEMKIKAFNLEKQQIIKNLTTLSPRSKVSNTDVISFEPLKVLLSHPAKLNRSTGGASGRFYLVIWVQ